MADETQIINDSSSTTDVEQEGLLIKIYNIKSFNSFLNTISKVSNWCTLAIMSGGTTAFCYGNKPYSDEGSLIIDQYSYRKVLTSKLIIDTNSLCLQPTFVAMHQLSGIISFIIKDVSEFRKSINTINELQQYQYTPITLSATYIQEYKQQQQGEVIIHIKPWIKGFTYQKNGETQEENKVIKLNAGFTYNQFLGGYFLVNQFNSNKSCYSMGYMLSGVQSNIQHFGENNGGIIFKSFDIEKNDEFISNTKNLESLDVWPYLYLIPSKTSLSVAPYYTCNLNVKFIKNISGAIIQTEQQIETYETYQMDIDTLSSLTIISSAISNQCYAIDSNGAVIDLDVASFIPNKQIHGSMLDQLNILDTSMKNEDDREYISRTLLL